MKHDAVLHNPKLLDDNDRNERIHGLFSCLNLKLSLYSINLSQKVFLLRLQHKANIRSWLQSGLYGVLQQPRSRPESITFV